MQLDLTAFDTEELLHLAISLTGQQRYGDALMCLKRAARLDPKSGAVVYFTAVIYAQLNLFERALTTMRQAVELDPALDIAHFQIGLLCFTSARLSEAIAAWQPLQRLGDEHPLYLFKTGLEALARDDFDACRSYLQRGMQANTQNAPLNKDMQAILDRIDSRKS